MQFSTKTFAPERIKSACLILPVIGDRTLIASGRAIDDALGGRLSKVLAGKDLKAKAGSTLLVHLEGALSRVLLVSVGEAGKPKPRSFQDAARAALKLACTLTAGEAASLLHEVEIDGRGLEWALSQQVLCAREVDYRFDEHKSKKEPRTGPGHLTLLLDSKNMRAAQAEFTRSVALADGVDLARNLGNRPGNVCTPTHLADEARRLGRQFKLRVEVLDTRKMQALKMRSLLSVAQGSQQPPKLIVVHYQGGPAKQAPVVLVGKGITFDTGGISLKPAAEMDEMKYDMSGAASVLGTLRAVAGMKLALNVIGVIPAAENMPGGRATRPGDIVASMSGQTIEILNTDAEGRLILCDALTYAERFKPAAVIDIATLTGACVIALGHHHTGLFTRADAQGDALAAELVKAGGEIGDTCWRMPLDEEYQEQLKSPFADVANVGGRAAGSVTAACFLARFTKQYDWAHLDIAGTAWRSGAAKGSTGRPVPLLTRFLMDRAGA